MYKATGAYRALFVLVCLCWYVGAGLSCCSPTSGVSTGVWHPGMRQGPCGAASPGVRDSLMGPLPNHAKDTSEHSVQRCCWVLHIWEGSASHGLCKPSRLAVLTLLWCWPGLT